MKIYPKLDEKLNGINVLKQYVEKYKGIEIQLFSFECINIAYEVIKKYKDEIPNIEEVTIHLPLVEDFNFEALAFAKFDEEKERLNVLIKASKEFNLKINLLYHTRWNYNTWISSGAIERMKELLELIQNTNVNILIENIYAVVEREECAVFKIAKHINNEHLKVCLDICHLHVEANMFKIPFNEFLKSYLNKNDCQKFIQQIHFSATLENDGLIRHDETHGKVHNSWKSFEEDYSILEQFGIEDKKIVTEVSEDYYSTRVDQIKEIEMLMKKVK